jgi:hypothetical protein
MPSKVIKKPCMGDVSYREQQQSKRVKSKENARKASSLKSGL